MKQILNERQRRFVEWVSAGFPAGRAYEKAGYRSQGDAANAAAARLLRNPHVTAYLRDLRKPRKSVAVLTLEKKREFLYHVVMTGAAAVEGTDMLCQSFRTPEGEAVRIPSKLRAIELDAKLTGELSRKESSSFRPDLQPNPGFQEAGGQVAEVMQRDIEYGLPGDEEQPSGMEKDGLSRQ